MTTVANQVKIEDVGPCRKKISITIPAEAVRQQIDDSLDALTVEAAVPGFRKGRAPKHLVQKRFGGAVKSEAKNQLVSTAYSEAIEEHKIAVIGDPEGAEELESLEVDPDKDISFSFEVDVAPEFELPDLSNLEIQKPSIEVTDEMVDKQLEKMATNNGQLEHQEKAEPGDYYIGHGVMKAKGEDEPILDINDSVIQVPSADGDGNGAILGVKVDDFRDQLGLPGVGETATIKVKGPKNHENPKIRDKDLVVEFTPERIERIVPLTTEQMVEGFGLADEQQLRETITLQLNRRAVIDQQSAMRQQVAKHLVQKTEFDLPKRLTDAQTARNVERARLELMYQGLDPQAVEQRLVELRSSSDERARRQLKLFFIVGKIANERQINVTESEMNGRIAQIAASRGMHPGELRQDLARRNQLSTIAMQIREHKVLDALAGEAKVKEIPLEEYNEKARQENEQAV